MANNKTAKNRIRTGHHYKPFLLFKCQLDGCCNFITQYGNIANKRICGNHQKSNGERYRGSSVSSRRHEKFTKKKVKSTVLKQCKMIEQLCHAEEYKKAPIQLTAF